MQHNMRIIQNLDEMTETARGWLSGGSVGFVQTRGYLHAGHLSLIREARRASEYCVVSIVLSPLQFASLDEFMLYPRDMEHDMQLLANERVDVVFAPKVGDLFPPEFATFVHPGGPVIERLEGAYHAASLHGYATIMTKLFSLIRPDLAYFGRKSVQHVALVRQLVRDLNIDVKLELLPTVRETDGLAYSSHTHQLSADERQAVSLIYPALLAAKTLIDQGERRLALIEKAMTNHVMLSPTLRLEYAVACDPITFVPSSEKGEMLPASPSEMLLVLAASVGKRRFADTICMRNGRWLL